MKKKLVFLLLIIVILFANTGVMAMETPTYSTCVASYTELENRLQTLRNRHVGTYWTLSGNPESEYKKSKEYYGWQCKGFGNYIFNELFCTGNIGPYHNTYKYYIVSPSYATELGRVANIASNDATTVKNMLSMASIGDMIQVKRRGSGNGHTMIVGGVSDTGITIFDCNSDGKCGVRWYNQSWAEFAGKNISMSLYHSTKYPNKKTYPYDVNGYIDGQEKRDLAGVATFDVFINGEQKGFGVSDFYQDCPDGSTYEIRNIQALPGYTYVGPSSSGGGLSGRINGGTMESFLMFTRNYYTFDLNGIVDDTEVRSLEGVGTVDIYMDGTRVADDVSDYTEQWPHGTVYEVTDFKANPGYAYTYAYKKGGGMTGRINAATMEVFPWFVSEGQSMSAGYSRVVPDGDYIIRNAADLDMTYYLDLPGIDSPASDGTNAALYVKKNGERIYPHDAWSLRYEGGYYTISQMGTDMTLAVANRRCGANVRVVNNDPSQKWAIEYSASDGAYRIQSSQSGYYLDVESDLAAEVNVRQWKTPTESAYWLLIPCQPATPVTDGQYVLVSGADGSKVLDIAGDSFDIANGTNVQLWSDEGPNMYNAFDVAQLRDGYYTLRQINSGKALEVESSATGIGMNVRMGTYNAGYHQQWAIQQAENGYMLISRATGFALEIEGGTAEDGANLCQGPRVGSAAQTWRLVPAENKVQYDANGGYGTPQTQTAYYRNDLTLSALRPTRLGYEFLGWAKTSDAGSAAYLPGGSYSVETDLTLYAVWKQAHRGELPDDLEGVEEKSFAGTLLQEIVVPEGCSAIGSKAFSNSPSLTAVVIPDSVTQIAADAFENSPNVVLYVHEGSYAQQYAIQRGLACVLIDE